MKGAEDAVLVDGSLFRFGRHDEGDGSHAEGLSQVAGQGQDARGDAVMHLFDRAHDGTVVGRSEQGCAQADEGQNQACLTDGDIGEDGEGQ